MIEQARFPVAIVGAADWQALREFLAALPADGGIAYLILSPELPTSESAALLQPHTPLPVHFVEQARTALEPDHIFLLPPTRVVSGVELPCLLMTAAATAGAAALAPVDACCKLLAPALGAYALGVVLAGEGADGALGLTHIREAGGVTAVQEPHSTHAAARPLHALAAAPVDLIAPAAALPAQLVAYARQLAAPAQCQADEPLPALLAEQLQQIQTHVFRHTGEDLAVFDPCYLLSRIEKRCRLLALPDLATYARLSGEQAHEARLLRQELLSSARQFLRQPQSLQSMVDSAITHILQAKGRPDQVRVWVAGCATGEEAYSVGILLLEAAARFGKLPEIRLFATDLNEEAIREARAGLFPATIAADVSADWLGRYFTPEGDLHRISQAVRQQIIFAPHNLFHTPPFLKLDLIICRNLLALFKPERRQQLVNLFHHCLQPHGYLLTDASVTLPADYYRRVQPGQPLYQRRLGNGSHPAPPLTEMHSAPAPQPTARYESLYNRHLQQHAPPGLLVNTDLNVVYYSAGVSAYLRQPTGEATEQVLLRVRPELRDALAAALLHTSQTGEPACSQSVPLPQEGGPHWVQTCVTPTEMAGAERYLLVSFRTAEPTAPPAPPAPLPVEDHVAHLQAALSDAQARLRATSEEYITMSEEMSVTNEELLSLNEELQLKAIELARSKEELQIANEELHAINREHQRNLQQLQLLTTNLQNLMAATNIPTLFLDSALCIRWFSPAVRALFNLLPGDEGRPLAHVTHHLHYNQFVQDAAEVMASLQKSDREVNSNAGRCYLMSMLPYRTNEQQIDGIVITFVDITERRRAEEALRQLNASLEQRVEERTLELARSNRELDQFAYVASHDLKAPLRAITNLAEWVQKDNAGALPAASQEHLTKLRMRIARMERLLEDLLTYSRVGRQRHQVEYIDLSDVIRGLRHVLLVPEGFRIATSGPLPTLMAERVPLETVLRNLVGNAIKHHDRPHEGAVTIAAAEHGDWVEISVTDNGPGIAPQHHARIFQIFQSLRPRDEVEGSGMGLAIAKKAVEAQGGCLQVESELGQGATFRFTWPKTADPQETGNHEQQSRP